MILVMALIRNHGQGADNHSNGSFLSCHGANDLVMKLLIMSGMNLMILVSEQMILVMDLMILVSEQMILVMELMILVNKLRILIGN